jgi:hypothetical protein
MNVFINCPFDSTYQEFFRAIVFTVKKLGFTPRCALEEINSAEQRIQKIKRIISECQYGIHDLSYTALDEINQLPRFNMPLELGLFLGIHNGGSNVSALILDKERYRYQKFISDIAGQDIKSHDGDIEILIKAIRSWLVSLVSPRKLLGDKKIYEDFCKFKGYLQQVLDEEGNTEPQYMELLEIIDVYFTLPESL